MNKSIDYDISKYGDKAPKIALDYQKYMRQITINKYHRGYITKTKMIHTTPEIKEDIKRLRKIFSEHSFPYGETDLEHNYVNTFQFLAQTFPTTKFIVEAIDTEGNNWKHVFQRAITTFVDLGRDASEED
jgi:hypothetical protein